jgi:hypothetical protein
MNRKKQNSVFFDVLESFAAQTRGAGFRLSPE